MLKGIVASALCNPVTGWVVGALFRNGIPFRGRRVCVSACTLNRTKAELLLGIYESAEARFVERFVDPRSDVIELGSSIGGISSVIAGRMARGCRLLCVEANPRLLGVLVENLRRNCPAGDARVIHGAIDYSGRSRVPLALGSSTLTSRTSGSATHGTADVPALTLKEVAGAATFERYCLVCDIEGAEIAMLTEDSDVLDRCDRMVIELHDAEHGGTRFRVDELIALVTKVTRMQLIAQYGSVCVFARI